MRKPSVIFMNRVYAPSRGASGRVLRDLARGFIREGWQVTVITTGKKPGMELDGAVRVLRVKSAGKPKNAIAYAWIWLKMFIVALRQGAPHLLITQSDPPLLAVAGQVVARFKKCRHIHWCHDVYPDLFPALGAKFPKFIMRFMKSRTLSALKAADKVVTIGRCMAKHLTNQGLESSKITMIPNWPDLELTQGDGGAAVSKSHKGLPPEKVWFEGAKPFDEQIKDGPKFRVLYAGNIGLAHPIETILAAAEVLNTDNPEIEFVFVGDGPRFDEISKRRGHGGLDNIRLLPYQPIERLRQIMESGDVHLISMKDDAAGLLVPCKLYSAFAAQRPCVFVGPSHCEAAHIIEEYKAGYVTAQGDVDALVAQIKNYRFNSDDWFAAQKGAAAAGEVFVPSAAIDAWVDRAWSVIKNEVPRPDEASKKAAPKADESTQEKSKPHVEAA